MAEDVGLEPRLSIPNAVCFTLHHILYKAHLIWEGQFPRMFGPPLPVYISRNTIARTLYIAFAASLSTRSVDTMAGNLISRPEVIVEGLPAVFQPTFTGCTDFNLCLFQNLILLFSFLIDGNLENPSMPSPFNRGRIGTAFGLTRTNF